MSKLRKTINFNESLVEHNLLFESYNYRLEGLLLYYSTKNPDYSSIFIGMTDREVYDLRSENIDENELISSFSLITIIESYFRIDYFLRYEYKKKDSLSKDLIKIYNRKKNRVNLEEEILKTWYSNGEITKSLYDKIKDLLKFRHWVAHGRYWKRKSIHNKYEISLVYNSLLEIIALKNLIKKSQVANYA